MSQFWAGAGGPAIEAGAGLVGFGLQKAFGSSPPSARDTMYASADLNRREQKYYNNRFGADLKRRAADSGLHPLALLGAPVAGGSMSPVGSSDSGNVWQDGANSLGRAAAKGVDAWLNRENQQKQNDLLDAQTEQIRAETAALNAREPEPWTPVPGPGMSGPGSVTGKRIGLPTPFKEVSALPFDERGRYYVTGPGGSTWYPDPQVAPAEVVEQLVGDVGSEGYGVAYGLHHAGQLDFGLPEVTKADEFSWWPKIEYERK